MACIPDTLKAVKGPSTDLLRQLYRRCASLSSSDPNLCHPAAIWWGVLPQPAPRQQHPLGWGRSCHMEYGIPCQECLKYLPDASHRRNSCALCHLQTPMLEGCLFIMLSKKQTTLDVAKAQPIRLGRRCCRQRASGRRS